MLRCSEVVGFWVGGLLNGGMKIPKRMGALSSAIAARRVWAGSPPWRQG
jgi:hypothetical protein